ncbi:transposase [Empedobacter sedimenti]|uniref:transposase n=1 Tax=Empedobacter sedimenti TaxID=3042610 RepID=UPI0024A69195|nr:transposase [Empedobacter sedimenti]
MKKYHSIHIGEYIRQRVSEIDVSEQRLCNFLKCTNSQLEKFFDSESLETEKILQFSKILEYDFFRIYSHHLILYSPKRTGNSQQSTLPQFRKSLYTKEIIEFILELIESKEKTIQEIQEEFKIPKTTLYKWISKYKK